MTIQTIQIRKIRIPSIPILNKNIYLIDYISKVLCILKIKNMYVGLVKSYKQLYFLISLRY